MEREINLLTNQFKVKGNVTNVDTAKTANKNNVHSKRGKKTT